MIKRTIPPVYTTELSVEPQPELVPAKVRTVAYFTLLVAAAIVLLAQGLAPIWYGEDIATKIAASAGVISAVLGLIGGGLGVAYRPTNTPTALPPAS